MTSKVAYMTITLHDDGALSVEGNIHDWKLCRNMLDAAHSALHSRLASKDQPETQLITDPALIHTGLLM